MKERVEWKLKVQTFADQRKNTMFVPFNPTDLLGRKNSARNLNLDLEVSGSDTEI